MRATLTLNGLIRDVRFDFYFRIFHVSIIYLCIYLFIFSILMILFLIYALKKQKVFVKLLFFVAHHFFQSVYDEVS